MDERIYQQRVIELLERIALGIEKMVMQLPVVAAPAARKAGKR